VHLATDSKKGCPVPSVQARHQPDPVRVKGRREDQRYRLFADSPGDRLLRNPITGIGCCCARAASGHAAAAPPTSVMNSRRLMRPSIAGLRSVSVARRLMSGLQRLGDM